jgi:glutamyl-tRNA synthetase
LGNARTYLIAWLLARHAGGRVVLRIEDIDSPRVKFGAARQALTDLRWLGLDWDAGPIVQTERLPLYESALARLREQECVYPCTCTRSDVARAASAPHGEGTEVVYPGTCAGRRAVAADRLAGRQFAWRFRVGEVPAFDDVIRGSLAYSRDEIGGDFVVWKLQAGPAYQLAVTVDDADNGITVVVRGDDLLTSTPRQLLLYRALGLEPPRFAHVPLVVGPDGRRLAKRHGDTRLGAIRAAGIRPEHVVGLFAWSCGWQSEPAPITAAELVPRFRLDTIPAPPFVITPELLSTVLGFNG